MRQAGLHRNDRAGSAVAAVLLRYIRIVHPEVPEGFASGAFERLSVGQPISWPSRSACRARRTTLRGRVNIEKRYLIQAACTNLSLLMRTLTGIGMPKQALAAAAPLFGTLIGAWRHHWTRWSSELASPAIIERFHYAEIA